MLTNFLQENENSNFQYQEEYIDRPRGARLFACSWKPTKAEPKAIIFLCHGYAMECSISMKGSLSIYLLIDSIHVFLNIKKMIN